MNTNVLDPNGESDNLKEAGNDNTSEEQERINDEGETIEETENKNGDAAEEAQEGEYGKRSYASPDFDDEEDE